MNTTTQSESPPAREVKLSRKAKVDLLWKMHFQKHWIELIRLIGYQTVPLEKARGDITLLTEKYGKEPVESACEVLFEIIMQDKEAFARLKPHIRRMSFQLLGYEPSPSAATPTDACAAPTSEQQTAAERPPTVETRTPPMPAKALAATTADAIPLPSGSRDSLMQQYRTAKERHPGMLLLFRMGDFYELFDQDAETAHRLLGLTLTTRDRTLAMAGFPHHQLEAYLRKLLHEGQRVAICEPVEESLARGPIRREVTRIASPGTMVEDSTSANGKERKPEEDAPVAKARAVRQPRHFVLKQFEAWLNEAGLAFDAIEQIRRATPAVAAYVGVLDFIVMRGNDKLLLTVRPRLQAKHLKAIRELQKLFGSEYKPMRMWPSDGPDGWNWLDYPVDISATDAT